MKKITTKYNTNIGNLQINLSVEINGIDTGSFSIISDDEKNIYYKSGKLHREDGPAIEYKDGWKEYYLFGEKLNISSNDELQKIIKLKAFI